MYDSVPLVGTSPFQELTTAQFVIPAGAGATFSATNNIATITTNAAHGLTMNPAANVLPNYYVTFGGSTSALTGTGILVGNYFRILSIPSTTTFTIYTTITSATVTSMTTIPVFFPSFAVGPNAVGGQPSMGSGAALVYYPFPVLGACMVNLTLAANLVCNYFPNQSATVTASPFVPLDATTTNQLGGTPAVAPVARTLVPASSQGQVEIAYPWAALVASGTTATSQISVIR
jgi:hypothetical protein